jgi:RNA polymerase sigma-70 factor (ECF subfamily)
MSPAHADWALSRQILSGDEHAFRSLFDQFFPRLYRFALAQLHGDRELAREIVQLTFCRGFERLDSYRAECSLYGWFCQICRNAMADAGRRRFHDKRYRADADGDTTEEALLESLSAPEADEPEQRLSRAQLIRVVQGALDCLPGHYGDVLEWKYLDGLSVREIAERLAVGPKAAESQLTRARHSFREAIRTIGGAVDMLGFPIEEET